ncbi:hypothetical protein TWF696_006462 [Orbilia brochopaga]|uniref:Uncharacterized protein n=1 Tax=Orbilia brochopaga TaxID=3140254 RepID=A0AAV9UZP7_9PEZI
MAISSSTAAPSVSLSTPYSLFSFSGPDSAVQSSSQHCYGSQVLHQAGLSRKRKRSEFAVAVDGHGVSVVDVQAPRIISTYSTPPTTRFTCSPLSIKYPNGSTRWTYASVSSESRSLFAWREQTLRRSSRTNSAVSSPASEFGPLDTTIEQHSRQVAGSASIVALHNLPRSIKGTDGPYFDDVLVVSDDASLKCLSADLQTERWAVNSRNTPSHRTRGRLLLSSIVPINVAKKTLLKNRLEVLAGYQAKPGDCVLITLNATQRKEDNVEATFYLISNSSALGHVRKLACTRLPTTGASDHSSFTFHAPTSKVFRRESQSVIAFDLSELVPEPENLLQTSSPISSLLPTSSSNVFLSTESSISVYNTRYGATHFALHTDAKSSSDQTAELGLHSSLIFLGYIPEIDVAVGFNKHGCFAIQLMKSGLFTGDTILDSLCKGVKSVDLEEGIETSKSRLTLIEDKLTGDDTKRSKEDRARAVLKMLGELAIEADAFGFEKEFAEFVGLHRKTGLHAIAKNASNGGSTNGPSHRNGDTTSHLLNGTNGASPTSSGDEDLPEFLYPPPEEGAVSEPQLEELSQPFVAAVLSMLFKPVFTDSGALELELTMSVPNVFKFLLWEGYFSCTNLPAQGSGFVEALAKFDPEFNLLLFFLENASNSAIPLKEVVTSVKVVMADLVRSSDDEATAAAAVREIDEMDLNEDTFDDEQLQLVTQQVEQALEQAQQLLDLSDTKERILRAALLRVGRFSRAAIIKALRETLNGAELAGLIRILRRELLRDADEREIPGTQDDADTAQDEEWLGLICDLLTSAVDAAGMTGLLLAKDTLVPFAADTTAVATTTTTTSDTEGELLLESLSTEVSATCDSLEGASQVSEALLHFLSRAQAYTNAKARSSARPKKPSARPHRQRKPEIVTRERRKAAVLPMGYPPPVDRKSAAGGVEQKMRQVRVRKYQKSLGVGAYSLERIEV